MKVEFEGDKYEVDENTKYMARDSNGTIYAYVKEPEITTNGWTGYLAGSPDLVDSPKNTWKHSLVKVAPEPILEWLLLLGYEPKGSFSATETDADNFLSQKNEVSGVEHRLKKIERIVLK